MRRLAAIELLDLATERICPVISLKSFEIEFVSGGTTTNPPVCTTQQQMALLRQHALAPQEAVYLFRNHGLKLKWSA